MTEWTGSGRLEMPVHPPLPEGYVIRPFRNLDEHQACYRLQQDTWGEGFQEGVPVSLLMVVPRVGGVVAGAFSAAGELAGFVFGISGVEDGRLVHWSDMLAVRGTERGRGLGQLLKWYQRSVLLEAGIGRIYWTFDPLESVNAYVNFHCLGTMAWEYQQDFYGRSDSQLHAGIGTDRLIVAWLLDSERVRKRLRAGPPPEEDIAHRATDAPLVNPVGGNGDSLVSARPDLGLSGHRVRIAVPRSLQDLKNRDLDLALDWRHKTRAAFQHYLREGYEVAGFRREGRFSSYVLERRPLSS